MKLCAIMGYTFRYLDHRDMPNVWRYGMAWHVVARFGLERILWRVAGGRSVQVLVWRCHIITTVLFVPTCVAHTSATILTLPSTTASCCFIFSLSLCLCLSLSVSLSLFFYRYMHVDGLG